MVFDLPKTRETPERKEVGRSTFSFQAPSLMSLEPLLERLSLTMVPSAQFTRASPESMTESCAGFAAPRIDAERTESDEAMC